MSFRETLKIFWESIRDIVGYSCLIIVSLILIGFLGSLFIYIYKNIFLGVPLFLEVPLFVIFVGIGTILLKFVLSRPFPKINYYVSLAVLLMTLILYVGSIFLYSFFPYDLPIVLTNYEHNVSVNCSYATPYTNFIEGYDLTCFGNLPTDFERNLVYRSIQYASNEENQLKEYDSGIASTPKEKRYTFFIQNITRKFVGYSMRFTYFNKENKSKDYFLFLSTKGRVFTIEEYTTNNIQRLSYFVALISLAIFSILSGISNFKQIVENSQNRNEEISKLKKEVEFLKEEIKKTTKKGKQK
jgi:hypothetical protein